VNAIVLLPVGVALFALALAALRRWPASGVVVVILMTLSEWEFPAQAPLFSIAGSNVFPLDVLCMLMAIAAAMSAPALLRNLGVARFAWYGFCALLIIGLIRGVVSFGLSTAVNEFRGFLYPVTVMTWAASLDWNPTMVRRAMGTLSMVQGWALVLLALAHIAVYGLGSADDEIDLATGLSQTLRPLVSGQALALLFCAVAVFALARGARRAWVYRASGVVFVVIVAIVQQRSVWAAGVAVIATVAIVGTGRARRGIAVAAAALLVIAAFTLPSFLASAGFSELSTSAESSGTYEGRVTSWNALIAQSLTKGTADVLFGIPSGFGWGRYEGPGRWVIWPPHNWYVTVYLRAGFVGLVLTVGFLLVVVLRLLRRGGVAAPALSIIVATAVYGWSYSWLVETAVFVGWAVAVGVQDRRPTGSDGAPAVVGADLLTVPFDPGPDGFGAAG
jgi:hypothetical protein